MPTLEALQQALQHKNLKAWCQSLQDLGLAEAEIQAISRILTHDQKLLQSHPDSLGSCLLARTATLEGLQKYRKQWTEELEASGKPWIRSLTPLPLPPGLISTLCSQGSLDLSLLPILEFPNEETVILQSRVTRHNSKQQRMEWTIGGDCRKASVPPKPSYPRFESDGWGPQFMIPHENGPRVELPCPPDASAYAKLARDGRTLIVYGTLDEYDGGFIYFINPQTLQIKRRLETDTPVWAVTNSEDGQTVVAKTSSGLIQWRGSKKSKLAIAGEELAVSPSGNLIAVKSTDAVQVWKLSEATGKKEASGFPRAFSPSGHRLIRGSNLYNGLTGHLIKPLAAQFGHYLEGGPARPWFHLGERFIINMHSGLQVWESASGEAVEPGIALQFPHWNKLAHNRNGDAMAVLQRAENVVAIYSLPDGERTHNIQFDLDSPVAAAFSPDSTFIAAMNNAFIEVRSLDGQLIHSHALGRDPSKSHEDLSWYRGSLSYLNEQQLAFTCQRWKVLDLESGEITITDSNNDPTKPRIAESWSFQGKARKLFVHQATGTQIMLPVDGDWLVHPQQANILLCQNAHIELRY